MKLKPINRVSVVESITERILSLISSGQVKLGERLPSEHELALRLGVGRSSIREALRSLAIMGLVESQSGRGTIVISPIVQTFGDDLKRKVTHWGLLDIFEVRLLLETKAAARAATYASNEDVDAIVKAAELVEERIRGGVSYFTENRDFHMRIAQASRNPVLAFSLSNIIGNFRDVREIATDKLQARDDVEDHRKIVAAIRNKSPNEAEDAMRQHLERNVKEITEAIDARDQVNRTSN